jgi:hypothetical protein
VRATVDSCAAMALDQLPHGLGPRFAESPLATLREGLGLTVRPVDQLDQVRADGGLCDGTSYFSDGVILYRRTGNRRENFTLAHELGHWLVDRVDGVYDWLAEQPEPMKMLETVCDRIASQLLLPDAAVAQVVGAGPVSARHIGELVDATQASRPACGIALASSLAGLGAVVIIDRLAGRVEYASVQPDPVHGWPKVFPWPGQPVPAGHPLAKLDDGLTLTRKTFWQTPWGARADFYVDAVGLSGRVVAVFSANDVWSAERLHLDPPREFDQRLELLVRCCGQTRTVRGYPCSTCKEPFCPSCQRCRCDRRAQSEVTCSKCYLAYQAHLVVGGLCEECRT